jgi:C4-dicarboxylate-specific signal transduction histidine kinase
LKVDKLLHLQTNPNFYQQAQIMIRNQSYLHNLKDLAHEPGEEKLQESSHENALIFEKISDDHIEQIIQQNQSMRQALEEADDKLKETQAQLAQAGKLATLGTLGAEIAHELNNPLTVVSAEADEIIEALGNGSFDKEFADISAKNIKKYAERMRVIIDHIRRYSRDDKNSVWEKVNINRPINDSLILLRSQLADSGISIELSLDENLPEIWGQINKLESIFQNLITNAADAFHSVNDGRDKKLRISTSMANTNRILVKITDNACGMSEEVKAKIFKSFFTTKVAGKGTGLGLAIVQNLVKEHRGIIHVDSQDGRGTEFELNFPVERRLNHNAK